MASIISNTWFHFQIELSPVIVNNEKWKYPEKYLNYVFFFKLLKK